LKISQHLANVEAKSRVALFPDPV